MADQVEIQIPKTVFDEESAFTATAYFRIRSTKAADTPTTIHYRVDCLSTKTELQAWTSVSAASSASIAITRAMNEIQDDTKSIETRQLTVLANKGLTDQATGSVRWKVRNLFGS